MKAKFRPGQLLSTPGAFQALVEAGQSPSFFLEKHLMGDWGDVCDDDAKANEEALKDESRLLSVYRTLFGVKLYVITEAVGDDGRRAATTILLPEEY